MKDWKVYRVNMKRPYKNNGVLSEIGSICADTYKLAERMDKLANDKRLESQRYRANPALPQYLAVYSRLLEDMTATLGSEAELYDDTMIAEC